MAETLAVKQGPSTKKLIIGWIVTILLPCLVMLLPVNEIMTAQLKLYLAITLAAVLFFVFEQVNSTVVALLLPIAYVLVLQAPAEAVYKPWSMSILWMLVGWWLFAGQCDGAGRFIAADCL